MRQPDNAWIYSKYLEMSDEIHLAAADGVLKMLDVYAKVIRSTDD